MKLFDSHCHLNDGAYINDMDEVVSRAHAAGVEAAMIIPRLFCFCGRAPP